MTDAYTRESLALLVDRTFPSERVCTVLAELIAQRGKPRALRMDNGPEFAALALRGLCEREGIRPAFIESGKLWQNGWAESFYARFRNEFLKGEAFLTVFDAQVRLEDWCRYWNVERLHSNSGYQTPSEFAAQWEATHHKVHLNVKSLISVGPEDGGRSERIKLPPIY